MKLKNNSLNAGGFAHPEISQEPILIQHRTEPRIDSRLFAKRAGLQHRSLYKLIKNNIKQLREFGSLPSFEIAAVNIATNAYQVNDSLLAGNNSIWANRSLSKNLVIQSAKIYANQSPKFTGNQSGEYFSGYKSADILRYSNLSHSKRGEFTPFAKGDFSHLMQGLIGVTTQGRIEFLESIKKGSQSATLGNVDIEYRASESYQHSDHFAVSTDKSECLVKNFDDNHFTFLLTFGYSDQALAKSSVRICTLNQLLATHDAPCVFFCVNAYAHLLNAVLYRSYSMVALVRQLSGWLDSSNSSSANLASVITPIEICTSGDDSLVKLLEIIVMMATPTQNQFKFLFLAVKRTDKTDTPHRIEATAPNEHDARLMLVRDYILSFAGRLPVKEVTA